MTDKTLAQELCEQINVWDIFGAIDDEDDLVLNVILPAFRKRIVALAEGWERAATVWTASDADADYSKGRHDAAIQTAQQLRVFAYELTADAIHQQGQVGR